MCADDGDRYWVAFGAEEEDLKGFGKQRPGSGRVGFLFSLFGLADLGLGGGTGR